jgi:isocitrate dehydrogenase
MVYTPADGGKPTTLEVYDFKGKGMYELFLHSSHLSLPLKESRCPCITQMRYLHQCFRLAFTSIPSVHHWVRPLVIQDGFGQEDDSGKYLILPVQLDVNRSQFMSTKNTIMKKYDGRFKDIFQEIYESCVLLHPPSRSTRLKCI